MLLNQSKSHTDLCRDTTSISGIFQVESQTLLQQAKKLSAQGKAICSLKQSIIIIIIQPHNPSGSIYLISMMVLFSFFFMVHTMYIYLKILYVLFHQVSFVCNHHRSANCVQVREMQFTVALLHIEWCLQLNVTTKKKKEHFHFVCSIMKNKIGGYWIKFCM